MLYSPTTDGNRRRRLVVVAGATALLLTAIAVFALLADRHDAPRQASELTSEPAPVTPTASDSASTGALTPVPRIVDPEQFARGVATALFNWDTARTLDEYTGRLLAVADPTGEESPGLVADIANYLPAPEAWLQLRPYYTQQWIDIDSVETPSLWSKAVAEAGPDGFLPGTTAYTIEGTRHRSGVWEGEPVASSHEVSFTVFVVCGPSYPRCYLLRLSRLDEPLR